MRRIRLLFAILFLLTITLSAYGQHIVEGVVLDVNQEPLIGVTIKEKGSSNVTGTDLNGRFKIVVSPNATLEVSYIGFKKLEVQVASRNNIEIILHEDLQLLDEVVVVGYGTQKKVNLTGAVSTVSSDRLEHRPAISASSALQGVSPGVTVTTQTGAPGGDGGAIRIRGVNSFGGSDSAPLVLVDGVAVGSIDMVEANTIENISVLKDAASSSIYGSRAANGVILITTKRAKGDKLSINYRTYLGYQTPSAIPEVTDGKVFMDFFNIANVNDNGYELYSKEEIENFIKVYKEDSDNFDWQKAILKGSGFTHNHHISLRTRNKNVSVIPSLSYSSQDGIIRNTGFKRISVRNNMDINANEFFKIKFDFSVLASNRKQIAHEGDVWNYLGRMPTNIPIKRNGKWSEGWVKINPIGLIEDGGNVQTKNLEVFGNLSVEYTPFEWLTFTGVVAPRLRMRRVHNFSKSVMTYNDDGSEAGAAYTYTDLEESSSNYYFGNYQLYSNLNKNWGNHNFGLMLGTSRESLDQEYLMGYRRDYIYDDYEVLDAGADNETKHNRGNRAQNLLLSAFGRLNYNYDERYLFEANLRYDGSSRFSKSNRWALFPSFSAGWRISEESFFEPLLSYINQLKLRASWGTLGNQNIGNSYYPYVSQLDASSMAMGGKIYQIVELNEMANPNLKWEETSMLGIGFDLLLINKLSITWDWYKKITDNILMRLYSSQLTGLNPPFQNAAKVQNIGWDLGIGYKDSWGDFDLGVDLSLSDVRNKILDMYRQTSGSLLRQQEGYPVNSIYGYVSDGLFQSQEEIDKSATQFGKLKLGDIKYKDISGPEGTPDGIINDDDKTIIGNTIPRYTFGLNLDMRWKGISLNAFFQGVGKVDGYLNSHYVIPGSMSSAIKTWQLDYWTPENTDASFPRPSISASNNTQNSDYWMKSAAYLRLKNLQLGYNFSKDALNSIGIKNAFIYINAQNLFTATKFWPGYSPEINYSAGATDGVSLGSGGYYPQVKTFTFGIDLTF